jgi:methylated-DNA-[protein]-cysteine S-methyltransferase
MMLHLLEEEVPTPIGGLLLVMDMAGALRAVEWKDGRERLPKLLGQHYGSGRYTLSHGAVSPQLREAFQAYFGGHVHVLDHLPVQPGGTAFQSKIWQALRAIPPGQSLSYRALGLQLGLLRHARAIGHANAANPINIVIPCHRLVGNGGSLTGYAGGLERKRWLLAHEATAGVPGDIVL